MEHSIKNQYLSQDKNVNIQDQIKKLKKEEDFNLKGIEIRSTTKSLGKNDFLKLLITQLSSQDPTNPVKDQAFIAQMAQFSSLEQMKNVAKGMEKMQMKQNYDLVGKFISGSDFVSGQEISGVVGAIFYDASGKAFARVKGRTIDVDSIQLISDPKVLLQENEKKLIEKQESLNNTVEQKNHLNQYQKQNLEKKNILQENLQKLKK